MFIYVTKEKRDRPGPEYRTRCRVNSIRTIGGVEKLLPICYITRGVEINLSSPGSSGLPIPCVARDRPRDAISIKKARDHVYIYIYI